MALLLLSLLSFSALFSLSATCKLDSCSPLDVFLQLPRSSPLLVTTTTSTHDPPPTYILYDVNPVEGFNLRRDVYIRMAVFIKSLQSSSPDTYQNVRLVLPPWSELFHWRSRHLNQKHIFWNQFFDLASLKEYANVIDMWEFWEEIRPYLKDPRDDVVVTEVYKLKHFQDMFENGVFVDKFEKTKCSPHETSAQELLGYRNLTAKRVTCLNFQGAASLLGKVLSKFEPKKKQETSGPRIVFIFNAEIVLHDHWGNVEFWKCRRSMRFNKELVERANDWRVDHFNSTDELDGISEFPRDEMRRRKGGDYLCAHLRRADFVYGREKTTPTLRSAATQIKRLAKQLSLDHVFLASDCSRAELMDLLSFMKRVRVHKFSADRESSGDGAEKALKDGEVAIIDQIICSRARYFIGTYESTFTYRIYEEREIFMFPTQDTFNTFCKNENLSDCERNSVWPIVY